MSWTLSAFTDEAGPSAQDQIDAALRAGLKFVDIRSIEGHNVTALPVPLAKEIKSRLDDAGLKVQMFGSPIGKIDIVEDMRVDLQKLRHLAELAPVLGCNAVRLFSYYNNENKPKHLWQAESLSRLLLLRGEAEELGLVLYHENERHIFGDLAADVKEIAQLRNAHLKLIFDFDNYNQSGEDVWENWVLLRDVTDSIHLKDSAKTEAGYQHTVVGEGGGQVKTIVADAVARGWSGPAAVEPHLSHSGAVAATGPGGIANASFASMPTAESFHVAVVAAQELLKAAGARVE